MSTVLDERRKWAEGILAVVSVLLSFPAHVQDRPVSSRRAQIQSVRCPHQLKVHWLTLRLTLLALGRTTINGELEKIAFKVSKDRKADFEKEGTFLFHV
jgi:hypothetical protein